MKTAVKKRLVLPLWIILAGLIGAETFRESGEASWYGPGFHGRLTASGERFDTESLTAAHKSLPFGSRVKVTNRDNGRSVVVRINDRGPFVEGRIIDLSRAAAAEIGMVESGTAPVVIELIESPVPPDERSGAPITVQVASFRERRNAETLTKRLLENGIESEIDEAAPYFRVIASPQSEEELESLLQRLENLGFDKPIIRRPRR